MVTVADPIRGTSEADRFWSSTNLGEAVPDVMSPMCWSVWEEPVERAWLYSMYVFGVLPRRKLVVSPNVNDRGVSCFYGRQAFNVDAIKEVMSDLPGVSPDDFERDLMGSVRPDAPRFAGSRRRVPFILGKAPVALVRLSGRLHRTHDEIREWWLHEVFEDGATDLEPIARLEGARMRFQEMFSLHASWRFVFQGGQSAVTEAASRAGDATLADQLLSGVGDVNETKMADDLWRLGQGIIGEAEFLRGWGYHGPNEGNVYTTVWRENPAPVRALAASYARRGERPADRAGRARAVGEAAEQKLLAATAAIRRPPMRWLMRRMRNIVRTLQVGKAGYLMAIDGARAATRAFGTQQVALGALGSVDDAFFLTIEECRDLAAGRLPEAQQIVSARRATRAEYEAMTLPVSFTGMPTPVVDATDPRERPTEISGAASGGGCAEGRARIVTDPEEEVELEDGDILVCRFTDPSWAPLMSLSEALVIDIGGSASHGAVVARELGIPYVIGTNVGTRVLDEGDRIFVDGQRNLVRVIQRAGAGGDGRA